jgi:DUF4097 and DUF4098 domain-containing protein YvlB
MRRMPSFAPLLLLATLLVSRGALAGDIKDTVKESFKVRPGGTLFVDIDHGNVEVEAARGDVVRIEVERSVDTDDADDAKELLDRHDLKIEQNGNNVSIESRFDTESGFWGKIRRGTHFRVRVYVQVPPQYNVDFSSGAGNIDIADLDGGVEGRTGAGNIGIGAVSGSVDVSSGSGNIQVEGARGLVEASTGAGNVELREVRGEVRVNTGAGNLTVYITEQPRNESRLSTGAGNVTVYLGDRVGVDVSAEASMGSAQTDFPLRVEGKWMRKSFEGRVNGGGPDLRMHAGVGNVALKRL